MERSAMYYTNLFNRLLEGNCTAAETAELVSWLGSEHADPQAAALISQQFAQASIPESIDPSVKEMLDNMLPSILSAAPAKVVPMRRRRYWPAIAAGLLLLVFAGSAILWQMRSPKPAAPLVVGPDVMPGTDKAVLTLSDGSRITLDSNGQHSLTQGGVNLNQHGGQLIYNGNDNGEVVYNTLTTPHGGQFSLVLPDGSKVWLNAVSALRYPVAFNGNERMVELDGQAYFEIAPGAEKPFRVKTATGTVTVLGTSFDIMAYADEASVNTTVVSGKVKVINGTDEAILTEGAQTAIDRKTGAMQVRAKGMVNIASVTAWKNGYFVFDNENVSSVLRQVQRWYGVEVKYEGKEEGHIEGEIPRDYALSEVLNILRICGIDCRLENKIIIVE